MSKKKKFYTVKIEGKPEGYIKRFGRNGDEAQIKGYMLMNSGLPVKSFR